MLHTCLINQNLARWSPTLTAAAAADVQPCWHTIKHFFESALELFWAVVFQIGPNLFFGESHIIRIDLEGYCCESRAEMDQYKDLR